MIYRTHRGIIFDTLKTSTWIDTRRDLLSAIHATTQDVVTELYYGYDSRLCEAVFLISVNGFVVGSTNCSISLLKDD